ncbi:hypothetical protein chiPu_0012807 [Chiloscyllium punctatum]|uniref:Ig-like domain-containing protein n=1 Tax=Chiloscyllium punctatum TaxID=137246 RepID=A0A401SV85_CHIPU|nr:hypothetical protein [Chiloscyllium punctatum]
MWSIVLLICSLPVSGALSAEKKVNGIVGRAITINCSYDKQYQQNMKYWCHGWTNQCTYVVRTDDPEGQRGRMSFKDNKARGVFIVTMENLHREDAGWYSCGIARPGLDLRFALTLQVSYESVSVPVISFSSSLNTPCSMSASCVSDQGSLPIRYTWYEQYSAKNSKVSDTNKLDLHCQSFTRHNHKYHCTASNTQGMKSSETVYVSVIHSSDGICSYVAQIHNSRFEFDCEVSPTISPTTSTIATTTSTTFSRPASVSKSYIIYSVIRWVLFAVLVICAVSVTIFTRKSKTLDEADGHNNTKMGK